MDYNFGEINGHNSETVHFWPQNGKAWMRLTTIQFFEFFVGFTNMGLGEHRFRVKAMKNSPKCGASIKL